MNCSKKLSALVLFAFHCLCIALRLMQATRVSVPRNPRTIPSMDHATKHVFISFIVWKFGNLGRPHCTAWHHQPTPPPHGRMPKFKRRKRINGISVIKQAFEAMKGVLDS